MLDLSLAGHGGLIESEVVPAGGEVEVFGLDRLVVLGGGDSDDGVEDVGDVGLGVELAGKRRPVGRYSSRTSVLSGRGL